MTERRFNSRHFSNIGSVLDKVLHQYRPKSDQALLKVWDIWEDAVGDGIAANARPAAFKGALLLVHVSNSRHAQAAVYGKGIDRKGQSRTGHRKSQSHST